MAEQRPEPRIETDRLILRPPRAEDAPRIAEQIGDYDVVRMLSRVPWPYRLEDADAYLATIEARDVSRDQPLAIEHRQHGLIGMSGFHTPPGALYPEVGYWLGREHWGQGYATETTTHALIWAHRDWGKRAIGSGHFVENETSGRVLIKCGFLYTGEVAPRLALARGEDALTRMMVWLA